MLYKNIETVDARIIKILIKDAEKRHDKIKDYYERYKGTEKGVPILTRKYYIDKVEQKDKINNKLANDFFGEIVDMKVGFFCGVPITYELDKKPYQITRQVIDETKTETDVETETVIPLKYNTDMDFITNF